MLLWWTVDLLLINFISYSLCVKRGVNLNRFIERNVFEFIKYHTAHIFYFENVILETYIWCVKRWTRLYIYLSTIVCFSEKILQFMHYKAENWCALSNEQQFLTDRFLDICSWFFKYWAMIICQACILMKGVKKQMKKLSLRKCKTF